MEGSFSPKVMSLTDDNRKDTYMKFTNGYWLLKEEYEPVYAVEYADRNVEGDNLTVYVPAKHVAGRSDSLNLGMLTFRFSSPADDVIKVSVTHFEGALEKGPYAEIHESAAHVSIQEDDEHILYRSGQTDAVISKRPGEWKIEFMSNGRVLTSTGYHSCARMLNKITKQSYMVEGLSIDIDENIYGLGERFTPFVKNGQSIDMWNGDGGTASEFSYKNIPFYITGKGYGVYVAHEEDVSFEIASEKVERAQFSVAGERLTYYVINGGSPKKTVSKYTELTGKPALPPAWSFGLWLTTSFTTNYDEKTTSSFIDGMAERNIPLRVFHFDCFWMKGFEWCNFTWDPDTFPDPIGMLQRYHERGLKICCWINPYIAQKSPLFREAKQKGYLLRKINGDVWQTDLWQAGMGVVDFTNPEAALWYQSFLKKLLDMGVDCFKTDFGERIPVRDIVYFDGSDPVKMHNYYTYLYNKTVFDLLEREKGSGEACLFARSATVGGQQFPVHWGGDCSASYPSMAETLRGGLSLACGGFGFWSHDISGFEQTASADIYKRWCQFGVFSSHSRLHGSVSYRVPWLFDEEACDVLRELVNLKCRLMPYIYSQAVETHISGIPMMRPMFMEFPEDRMCDVLDKEYMLGDSILVAPVFKESGECEYYLPKGRWYNLITKKTYEGGSWIKEKFDYRSFPLLARENTILVYGAREDVPDYDYAENAEVCMVYLQDGHTERQRIYSVKGEKLVEIEAVRRKDTIHVVVKGDCGSLRFTVISDETLKLDVVKE